jgi:hypothetical protein
VFIFGGFIVRGFLTLQFDSWGQFGDDVPLRLFISFVTCMWTTIVVGDDIVNKTFAKIDSFKTHLNPNYVNVKLGQCS